MAPEFRHIRAGKTDAKTGTELGYISFTPPLDKERFPALRLAVGRTANNFHGATEIITKPDEALETATKVEAFLRSLGDMVTRDYQNEFEISCNDTDTLVIKNVWQDLSRRNNMEPWQPAGREE
jgi:hypothetical protein